jgi:hypothetical protein
LHPQRIGGFAWFQAKPPQSALPGIAQETRTSGMDNKRWRRVEELYTPLWNTILTSGAPFW